MNTGLFIAMLGIDGTGKTTMTKMLAKALSENGHEVKELHWRHELHRAERPNTRETLRQLWVESLRLVYLGVDGPPAPASYDEFAAGKWEERYAGTEFSTNVPAGPLAAAWLEWVGQVIIWNEIVQPHRARGVHVIDESFSLKMAFKELLLAERLAEDPAMKEEIARARQILIDLFVTITPDVGILVTGPLEQAYHWRTRDGGLLGSLEDLGAANGDRGRAGYLEIQGECDAFFRDFAEKWGWVVFEVKDASGEENFDRLRKMLLEHPRIGKLLERA